MATTSGVGPERKDTKLSLALLDSIIICGQCGALFLALGWSNSTHLAWHASGSK